MPTDTPPPIATLESFLARHRRNPPPGPIAVIFAEDEVALAGTLRHHLRAGFASVLLICHAAPDLPPDLRPESCPALHLLRADLFAPDVLTQTMNRLIAAFPGSWFYYGYNAEYLFYPFCESRTIRELIAFHSEERRDAALSYVIDLYAGDLDTHPDAVAPEAALFDRTGYFGLARPDPANLGHPRERQLDFFGGLRWRFEEHVPADRRKIDRIALFRAQHGLELRADHTFNIQEYNTYACPWHHNITLAVASFRTAKALKSNPGSTYDIPTFRWRNSVPFDWSSQQLMDLGLMEPGQWF